MNARLAHDKESSEVMVHPAQRLARSSARAGRVLAVLTGLFVVGLATAVSAGASPLTIERFDGDVLSATGSAFTQAGGHPFSASTSIDWSTSPDVHGQVRPDNGGAKDVHVELPPGFVGNPTAVATCPEQELAYDRARCPLNSQVGVVYVDQGNGVYDDFGIYNVPAPPGYPAAFGFNVYSVVVHLYPSIRPGDYGLNVDTLNTNQALPVVRVKVALWGVPTDRGHDMQRGDCAESYSTGDLSG